MKVLESFLISLGLKVDEKSFQQGNNAFNGLTSSALKLGAVLASKLAIDKVVGDFKSAGTELNNFNRLTGLSTQNVQALGQALVAQGGNAQDAFSAMQKIQDLMASPITGNVGWFGDVAKLGLDPSAIIGAQDTAEALANIAGAFEKMTPLNQRLAGQALGFDENTIRLLMRGRDEVERQLDSRGKLAIMTQKQVDDAARLTKASAELDQVFTDMGNTIAGELAPAFADMAEDFVDFYRSNQDLIDSGLKEFFGALADNIELVSIALTLMGGAGALRGLVALRSLVGLGGASAAASGGTAAAAAAAGLSARTVMGGSAAALLYSSKLNVGEDEELLKNRLRKGGNEAAGAVIDFFRAKGWSAEQAAGIAANLQQESGFRADAEGDGGNAYGIAQWHKDRQDNFARFSGKDIRGSSAAEQLEFIHHELTKGAEKAAGERLRMAATAREAAGVVSQYYERPADRDGEVSRRGDLADSYGLPAAPEAPAAPVLDLSDPEVWARVQAEMSAPSTGKPSALADLEAWMKSQRKAPAEYSAGDVMGPASSQPAAGAATQVPPAGPVQNIDQRQFHIHGADTEKVKQLYNEQLSTLIDQTAQDFRSPEK